MRGRGGGRGGRGGDGDLEGTGLISSNMTGDDADGGRCSWRLAMVFEGMYWHCGRLGVGIKVSLEYRILKCVRY